MEFNFPWPIINSSNQLIDKIKSLDVDYFDGISLISFDFESLYTNISPNIIHDTLFKVTSICDYPFEYFNYLFTLYNFTCKYSNFTIGSCLFKQNIGVQMGSYHSAQIANLVLVYREFFIFF